MIFHVIPHPPYVCTSCPRHTTLLDFHFFNFCILNFFNLVFFLMISHLIRQPLMFKPLAPAILHFCIFEFLYFQILVFFVFFTFLILYFRNDISPTTSLPNICTLSLSLQISEQYLTNLF